MAYKTKKLLSKRCNYGTKRLLKTIKFLVFHYTANDGDTDEANANYFHNNNVGASAHVFIDDDSITISVPHNYIAWAVGSTGWLDQGSPYRDKGHKFWGKCTNANSLSIEMCDTKRDGKHNLSAKTRQNAIDYGARQMIKYDIPIERVIRHFDVNGKLCPIFWVTNESDWLKFKKELQAKVKELSGDDSKKSASSTPKTDSEAKKDPVKTEKPTSTGVYKVQITANTLNIREKADINSKVVGTVKKDEVYTIVGETTNGGIKWGKLKSGVGYISLNTKYSKKL